MRDPQCSPDGKWVAYTATTDAKEDKHDAHVWMIGYDGKHDLQVTSSQESEEGAALESGRKIFVVSSSRPGKAKGNQVWLLERGR